MGSEDEAEQSIGRPCRLTNGRSKRTNELTSSIVPRGTSFHRRVELEFLLSDMILHGCHTAAAACSLVHRNSVVAVGTEISLRPPHRSRRALLTHRAPTLDGDEKPLFGPRVQDAWEWQVPVSDLLHSHPR